MVLRIVHIGMIIKTKSNSNELQLTLYSLSEMYEHYIQLMHIFSDEYFWTGFAQYNLSYPPLIWTILLPT